MGWVIIFFTLMLGTATIIFILIWFKHHELVLRDTINNQSYIRKYWIIEKKDKDTGILYWVSVWGKNVLKTPKPPASSIDVMKRGKKHAEAYRVSEDEFIWIADKGIEMVEVVDEDGNKKKVVKDVMTDGSYSTIDSFKPFGAVPREVLVNQHRKAAELRSKRWTADKVINIVSLGVIGMIIVMAIVYWGEMMQPIKEMYSMNEARENRLIKLEQQITEAANRCSSTQALNPESINTINVPGDKPPT